MDSREEPKPLISIQGELDLVGPVMQKNLQTRLKTLQKDGYGKEHARFSSLCNGVDFVKFQSLVQSREGRPAHIHQQPCVHTYWTACYDSHTYANTTKPNISHWLTKVEEIGGLVDTFIVYCITAEVRTKRPRAPGLLLKAGFIEHVEEVMAKDFREKVNHIVTLRLASADSNRIAASFTQFTLELNQSCVASFLQLIDMADKQMTASRSGTLRSQMIHDHLCRKLSLAVAQEMIRQPLQALRSYSSVHSELEKAITHFASAANKPDWLVQLSEVTCKCWDYPKLMMPNTAWKYLHNFLENKSHVLQVWTFLLCRQAAILCQLGEVEKVYDVCLQTLHCTARAIRHLKLKLPVGAFDCWAYMTCMEAVQAIMLMIEPDVLAKTPSALLVLIRAELWYYAWEKLRAIGMLCNLMPSKDNSSLLLPVINTLCDGITSFPFEEDEDQGKLMVNILKSKETFKKSFMSLGETVIGAFKHAGRRRMAFSVGTMMAQFHRDVGLVQEAEQLLHDVVSLHSVQRWPQLSSSAYSILANCQKTLKQEDKQVNSLLVLVTTPTCDHPPHNPAKFMEQLMYIADRSRYQKLLPWEPLFDLEHLVVERAGQEGEEPQYHHCGDTVTMKCTFHYNGPTSIKVTMASVVMEYGAHATNATLVDEPDSTRSDIGEAVISTAQMEDVPLDPGPAEEDLANSRPIGGDEGSKLHKVYYSSDLLGMEEERKMVKHMNLNCMGLTVHPGTNTITMTGKMSTPGCYCPQHILLKCGALDFMSVLPTPIAQQCEVSVLPDKVDITVSLQPQSPVILSDEAVTVQLRVLTGSETSVSDGAGLRITGPPGVEFERPDVDSDGPQRSLSLTLPAIEPDSSSCMLFDVTFSSAYHHSHLPSSERELPKPSNDNSITGWQYELEVHCDWLSPPHVAKLPVVVHEPFVYSHQEHTAGESAFLQLTMQNSSPISLQVTDHSLSNSIDLVPLYSTLPEIFQPGETFSFIWQSRKGNLETMGMTSACLKLSYKNPHDNSVLSRPSRYNFSISNMEAVYSIKSKVEHPASMVMGQLSTLSFSIANITQGFRGNEQATDNIKYTIVADSTAWSVGGATTGMVHAPQIAETARVCVNVTPKQGGSLRLPWLSLVPKDDNLTGSQCCNLSRWQFIDVQEH